MSPANVVITGCNRGIGLELVKQFLKSSCPPKNLIATYRNPSTSLELLDLAKSNPSLHLLTLDVSRADPSAFDKFASSVGDIVGDDGVNLLINNAGTLNREESATLEAMREAFEVNCLSPQFLTKSMLPLIKSAASKSSSKPAGVDRAAVIMMSTAMASISDNGSGGMTAYRVSKVALNMVMKNMSLEMMGEGVLVMSMHPGWVKTDMGGSGALIDTETCCVKMLETLSKLTEKDNGAFKKFDNSELQW